MLYWYSIKFRKRPARSKSPCLSVSASVSQPPPPLPARRILVHYILKRKHRYPRRDGVHERPKREGPEISKPFMKIMENTHNERHDVEGMGTVPRLDSDALSVLLTVLGLDYGVQFWL